jgi:ABC-2 type transport system permease protein
MTATTQTADALARVRLSGGGIVASEWVKLVTLRSTWWCLMIIAGLTIGIPAAISLALGSPEPVGAAAADVGYLNWMMATTVPTGFTVLAAAVLGCLVITGEYGTGMIRSTMTAAPRRLSTLLAKSLVIGAAVFGVALVALVIGAALSGVILSGAGYTIDPGDGRVWVSMLLAAAYPALIAVFSTGVGTIIRNSAGAIAAVLGLLLVVPTIVQLIGSLLQARWLFDAGAFLPSSLGSTMYTPAVADAMTFTQGTVVLEPWQAALALVAWVVAALAGGGLVIIRRDV